MRRVLGLAFALSSFGACTFGGIGDYDVQSCDPHKATQAQDDCDRLNAGALDCMPFQCDLATKRCIAKPRDDDRDGDGPTSCGGGDCDDGNPSISSEVAPLPVEERIVDGLAAGNEFQISNAIDGEASAAYIAAGADIASDGKCIQIVRLAETVAPIRAGCAVLVEDEQLVPRQPYGRALTTGGAAAFVSLSGCARGAVGFGFGSTGGSSGVHVVADCTAAGAALPAFVAPEGGNGLVAWYATALATRERPDDAAACKTIVHAPLLIATLTSSSIDPRLGPAVVLAPDTTSVRAPALVPVPGTSWTLVASPSANDVGVWLIDATGHTLAQASFGVGALSNARGASIAVRVAPSQIEFAVSAEIGCQPQGIAVGFGILDVAAKRITLVSASSVAPSGPSVAVRPTVAAVESRGGWFVAWTSDGPRTNVRRYRPDGTAWADGYLLAEQTIASIAMPSGAAIVFRTNDGGGGTFLRAPLRCP